MTHWNKSHQGKLAPPLFLLHFVDNARINWPYLDVIGLVLGYNMTLCKWIEADLEETSGYIEK